MNDNNEWTAHERFDTYEPDYRATLDDGSELSLWECTAVALLSGDTEDQRQKAVYGEIWNGSEIYDFVMFDAEVPDDNDSPDDWLCQPDYFSSWDEEIQTCRTRNGLI